MFFSSVERKKWMTDHIPSKVVTTTGEENIYVLMIHNHFHLQRRKNPELGINH